MKNRQTLFSRKGVAVEYAIMIMVVIMGLSTIILTNSMLQATHRNRLEAEFFANMDMESIGYSFVSDYPDNAADWETKWEQKYSIKVVSNNPYRELYVRELGGNDDSPVLLYVKVKQFGILTPTIEVWERYS